MCMKFTQLIIQFIQLTRLDKPIGIVLLLYPTLLGLMVLQPSATLLSLDFLINALIFTLGTILMRSSGCIINDIFDADIDKHVTRTQNRPLAQQSITKKQALQWFYLLMLLSLILLAYLPSHIYGYAFIAGLLACSYPLAKRWLAIPQAYLGISFSMGMCMAYVLYRPIDQLIILLMLANSLWVIAYDTAYAMVDKPDDLKLGIYTSAIFFGKYDKFITSSLVIIYNLIHAFLAYTYQLNALFWYIWLAMNLHAILSIYYLYRKCPLKKLNSKAKQTNELAKITRYLSQDLKSLDYFTVFKQAHCLGLLTLLAWVLGGI